jgi:hypothetical protein
VDYLYDGHVFFNVYLAHSVDIDNTFSINQGTVQCHKIFFTSAFFPRISFPSNDFRTLTVNKQTK